MHMAEYYPKPSVLVCYVMIPPLLAVIVNPQSPDGVGLLLEESRAGPTV